MINKKLFTVLFLGILGTLIVITAIKFLPLQKAFKQNHAAKDQAIQGTVTEINDASELKKALEGDNPVVIKFHADWCGACNYVKGPFAAVSNEVSNAHFYEVNVDNQDIMTYVDEHKVAKDGVEALPTFVLRQGDKVNEQFVGGMSKEKLAEKIKNAFS